MEANTVTLIVGLSGIGATLIASGLGIYFTAKSRSSVLREILFKKQLDLIARTIRTQGRFMVYATIMTGDDDKDKELAGEDFRACMKEFYEINIECISILPTNLCVEVKRLNDHMMGILGSYYKGGAISEESLKILHAMAGKIALLSRTVIGADELTEESLNLFSSKKEYERLVNMEIEYIKKLQQKDSA